MVTPSHSTASQLLLILLFLQSGCSTLRTQQKHYGGTDTLLRMGQPQTALTQLQSHTPPSKNQLLHLLDVGMLQHWSGHYAQSNKTLEQARQHFEKLRPQSLTELPKRLLINDTTTDYTGEDSEEIYLHIFKALNHLALDQFDAAWVEIRQLDQKLIHIQSDYETAYQNIPHPPDPFTPADHPFHESALARWLGMLLYRTEGRWDDVRIDQHRLQTAYQQQQSLYPFPPPDFSTFKQPLNDQEARLTLLGFHGLTPLKEAQSLTLHTEENLILLTQSHTDDLGRSGLAGWELIPWPGINAGLHFTLQLPQLQPRPSQIHTIEVLINGEQTHRLQPLESLEAITQKSFNHRRPLLYLRTLTRALGKALLYDQTTQSLTQEMNQGWSTLTRLAIGALIDQTEHADLRTARFFPAQAAIAEIILPAGTHTLQFNYLSSDNRLIHSDPPRTIQLHPHQLNLEQAAYLD